MNDEERVRGDEWYEHMELAGNAETMEWLWDHHFAVVAGMQLR